MSIEYILNLLLPVFIVRLNIAGARETWFAAEAKKRAQDALRNVIKESVANKSAALIISARSMLVCWKTRAATANKGRRLNQPHESRSKVE